MSELDNKFPIQKVDSLGQQLEQLGTKKKFWFDLPPDDGSLNFPALCKIGRPNTGENWAEKVACEISKLIGIPCANYELAVTDRGDDAVVTPRFLNNDEELIHGNMILSKTIENFPSQSSIQLRKYRINTVIACLKRLSPSVTPPVGFEHSPSGEEQSIVDSFITYLMLDCLIGNQDRHDENWGIIVNFSKKLFNFAPTFDHASSLACRMGDEERKKRLETKDKGYSLDTYLLRAKTPFFDAKGESRLTTIDCLDQAIKISKSEKIATSWIDRLSSLSEDKITMIFEKFPDGYLSEETISFSIVYILKNRDRILALR